MMQVCTMLTAMVREHQENASVLDQDQSLPTESWMRATDMIWLTRRLTTWAGVLKFLKSTEQNFIYISSRRAIYHATFRDAASGGVVRVYHMKPTGFEVISEQDCKELHYLYADEKKK